MSETSVISLPGSYTLEGANKFSQRHSHTLMKLWNSDQVNKISNIGIGTYKGSLDPQDDILQFNAIIDSVLSGVNMIDTCSNFRGGRSELVISRALRFLQDQKKYERN